MLDPSCAASMVGRRRAEGLRATRTHSTAALISLRRARRGGHLESAAGARPRIVLNTAPHVSFKLRVPSCFAGARTLGETRQLGGRAGGLRVRSRLLALDKSEFTPSTLP